MGMRWLVGRVKVLDALIFLLSLSEIRSPRPVKVTVRSTSDSRGMSSEKIRGGRAAAARSTFSTSFHVSPAVTWRIGGPLLQSTLRRVYSIPLYVYTFTRTQRFGLECRLKKVPVRYLHSYNFLYAFIIIIRVFFLLFFPLNRGLERKSLGARSIFFSPFSFASSMKREKSFSVDQRLAVNERILIEQFSFSTEME